LASVLMLVVAASTCCRNISIQHVWKTNSWCYGKNHQQQQ